MSRLKQIESIIDTDKNTLGRKACSFMQTATLLYLSTLKDTAGMKADDLPEPFRSDVKDSYKKAKEQTR